ncbi:hypothetical protein ACCO45_003411 [Purpureocillium lilacinum]|uniref:Uncharacterized protein n=1 Tax=Purpureocillium lilacinum TaxID=33203 RepID=A0ACC4E0R1_PURLI
MAARRISRQGPMGDFLFWVFPQESHRIARLLVKKRLARLVGHQKQRDGPAFADIALSNSLLEVRVCVLVHLRSEHRGSVERQDNADLAGAEDDWRAGKTAPISERLRAYWVAGIALSLAEMAAAHVGPHIQTGTRASTRTKQHWTRAARNRVHGTETHGPGWTDHGEVPQVPRPRTFDFDTRRLLSPNSRAARVDLAWSLPGCDGESGPGGTWPACCKRAAQSPVDAISTGGQRRTPQRTASVTTSTRSVSGAHVWRLPEAGRSREHRGQAQPEACRPPLSQARSLALLCLVVSVRCRLLVALMVVPSGSRAEGEDG